MGRLWVRIIKNHKIAQSVTAPCAPGEETQVLTAVCAKLDVPRPIFLGKHEREFASFRRTSFAPEHFVEAVRFDKLEMEYLDDDAQKKKSRDPRNDFSS